MTLLPPIARQRVAEVEASLLLHGVHMVGLKWAE